MFHSHDKTLRLAASDKGIVDRFAQPIFPVRGRENRPCGPTGRRLAGRAAAWSAGLEELRPHGRAEGIFHAVCIAVIVSLRGLGHCDLTHQGGGAGSGGEDLHGMRQGDFRGFC